MGTLVAALFAEGAGIVSTFAGGELAAFPHALNARHNNKTSRIPVFMFDPYI
jgi:hypothetical protein